jgi:hypothetical protein
VIVLLLHELRTYGSRRCQRRFPWRLATAYCSRYSRALLRRKP